MGAAGAEAGGGGGVWDAGGGGGGRGEDDGGETAAAAATAGGMSPEAPSVRHRVRTDGAWVRVVTGAGGGPPPMPGGDSADGVGSGGGHSIHGGDGSSDDDDDNGGGDGGRGRLSRASLPTTTTSDRDDAPATPLPADGTPIVEAQADGAAVAATAAPPPSLLPPPHCGTCRCGKVPDDVVVPPPLLRSLPPDTTAASSVTAPPASGRSGSIGEYGDGGDTGEVGSGGSGGDGGGGGKQRRRGGLVVVDGPTESSASTSRSSSYVMQSPASDGRALAAAALRSAAGDSGGGVFGEEGGGGGTMVDAALRRGAAQPIGCPGAPGVGRRVAPVGEEGDRRSSSPLPPEWPPQAWPPSPNGLRRRPSVVDASSATATPGMPVGQPLSSPQLVLLPSEDGGSARADRFWVPLRVPMRRRLQTLAVLGFMLLGPLQLACWFWTGAALLNPLTTLPMVAYLTFITRGDPPAAATRRYDHLRGYLRSCMLLRLFTSYFPMALVRTASLPPSRRYVFGIHPHGVISMGAFSHFATATTGWDELFPGVTPHLLTLVANLKVPFFRELLLALRVVDASRETCAAVLDGPPGSSLAIVVGGAAEALDSRPGTYVVNLHHRGFVRVAAAAGADLVPVLSFHENDLFRILAPGRASPLRRGQEWVKRKFRWAPVLFHGRGAFNYYYGLLPYRRRVVTVVGAPIPVPRVGGDLRRDPDAVALIEAVHRRYADALRELFFAHADAYDPHRRADIDIRM